jgi:hypothetical protein
MIVIEVNFISTKLSKYMDTTIANKIDLLLQYILAIAAEEDDYINRSLSPIHLIKYVYLADLAYAEANNGETYTAIKWQFYKFGPWSIDVFNRIEPACNAIQAEKKSIESDYEDDFTRWSLTRDISIGDIQRKIDSTISVALKFAIHKYGSDTKSLLAYVYLTKPMLCAAPKEYLDFTQAIIPKFNRNEINQRNDKVYSKKQLKKITQKSEEVRRAIQIKLDQKKQQEKLTKYNPLPRYDEIFQQGQAWLNSLAGDEISELKGEAIFANDIWKSKTRFDPDVS